MAQKVREDADPVEPIAIQTQRTGAPDSDPSDVKVAEQYIVTTKNTAFTGTIMGVQITNGRGLLNRQSVDPRLHRSFEKVVSELSVLPGYTVTPAA